MAQANTDSWPSARTPLPYSPELWNLPGLGLCSVIRKFNSAVIGGLLYAGFLLFIFIYSTEKTRSVSKEPAFW